LSVWVFRSGTPQQQELPAKVLAHDDREIRDLAVLEDDKYYFPPYQAVPMVRRETLRRHPAVREAINQLGGKISDEEMRRLNYAVDGEHRDLPEVVREFLRTKHLD